MILTKRLNILVFILPILFLLPRCEVKLHDIPETKIDPLQEGPPIILRLNDFKDTIKLGWVTNFQYDFLGTNNKILSVKIIFEGTEIHHYDISHNKQNFSFVFNPSSYSNGNYHLNVEVITGTGTGSIADKLDAEVFLYKMEWPVYIDKTLPEGIYNYTISAIHTEKGIELTWPSFNHVNFISYEVFRHYSFIQPKGVSIATITDPLNNKYIDTTFWEGTSCRYWVRINTPAGGLSGEYRWVYPTLGKLEATFNPDKTIDVRWDKAKNLESFGKYFVYAGHSSGNTCIFDTCIIEDPDQNYTTFNFGAFGSTLYIFLKIIPPGVNESQYRYIDFKRIQLTILPIIPRHHASFSVRDRDYILLASNSAIYRYYPRQLWVEDSFYDNLLSSCQMAISNNGSRFIYYSDGKFYVKKTDDFILENEFTGPPLDSLGRQMLYYTLSDNGRMVALDNNGISYLYDINSGNLLNQDTLIIDGYKAQILVISKDGTKLVAKTELSDCPAVFYTYGQVGWVESGRSDIDPEKILYSADGSLIYVTYLRSLQTRNANDFSIVKSYPFITGYLENIDFKNNRFLWWNVGTQKYTVGDLSTGATIRILDLGYEGSLNLFDNYVIATSGYQLTIHEF